MKKLLIILFAIFTFIGCGKDNPESVAKDFMTNLYEGNADKVVSMLYIDEKTEKTNGAKDIVKGKISMLVGEAKSQASKKGGVESIEVQKAEVIDGNTSYLLVPMNITFKDKSSKKDRVKLVEIDGKYKVLLK